MLVHDKDFTSEESNWYFEDLHVIKTHVHMHNWAWILERKYKPKKNFHMKLRIITFYFKISLKFAVVMVELNLLEMSAKTIFEWSVF